MLKDIIISLTLALLVLEVIRLNKTLSAHIKAERNKPLPEKFIAEVATHVNNTVKKTETRINLIVETLKVQDKQIELLNASLGRLNTRIRGVHDKLESDPK